MLAVGIGLGLLGVIGVVAYSVIVRIRRPDGTQQEMRLPDGSEVTVSNSLLRSTTGAAPGEGRGARANVSPLSSGEGQGVREVSSFVGPNGNWKLPPGAPPPAVAPFDATKAKEHQEAWAKQLGVPVEITNSIGMKLMLIPPGEFMMGSPKELIEEELKSARGDDKWCEDRLPGEGPRHAVRITRPFYLGTYLVTQEEYQRVMDDNPSDFSAKGKNKDNVAGQDTKRFPVECVSWQDSNEFCSRLSEMPEEKSAGWRYRLPSEAQWEHACRAGTTGTWFFSPVSDEGGAEENLLSDYAWFSDNSGARPHEVASKRANAWGLYDMHGNVWEWCQDWYDKDFYAKSAKDDPVGSPGGTDRVHRGGSWADPAGGCRSARRNHDAPERRGKYLGFRVCLMLPDAAAESATTSPDTDVAQPSGDTVIKESSPAVASPDARSSAPVHREAAAAPSDGDWRDAIDLLPLIDADMDTVSGSWVARPGGSGADDVELLATDIKSMSQKMQPPYRPAEEYDYRVSFSPVAGNADVAIGLTAAGRSFVFYMKKFSADHCLGFEAIGGKAIAEGPTARHFPHLQHGRRYTVVIHVRKQGLNAWLDGKPVAEWATDYHDMSAWPVWKFKDDTLLGFGCSLSTVAFDEIKVREVTGKGTFTCATPDANPR